jgi:hypothetical protein
VLHDAADLQQNMTGLPVNLGVADAAFIFNDIDSGRPSGKAEEATCLLRTLFLPAPDCIAPSHPLSACDAPLRSSACATAASLADSENEVPNSRYSHCTSLVS